MKDECKATIFLSGQRSCSETALHRSYSILDTGGEKELPIRRLTDDTLAGGAAIELQIEENVEFILLPVAGAVVYSDSSGNEALVRAGEIQFITVSSGTTITLRNPYESELVNFLQLWMQGGSTWISPSVFSFDLNKNRNVLLPVSMAGFKTKLGIAKLWGRKEILHKTSNRHNSLFAFVIEGAFEVQHRLLEERDGLALWGIEEAELEALSNDAIILLIESEAGQ